MSSIFGAHPKPWRVEVNPFGSSDDGSDNIFIVNSEGSVVLIVGKHPAWNYMEKARMSVAEEIVRMVNESP